MLGRNHTPLEQPARDPGADPRPGFSLGGARD
jgi:hypothetical protein